MQKMQKRNWNRTGQERQKLDNVNNSVNLRVFAKKKYDEPANASPATENASMSLLDDGDRGIGVGSD